MTSILLLQHQRPDGEVDSYHLKAGRRYHLGRGSQCQVRILDLKLSRQHCAFECDGSDWLLVDLASTNGCAVDGERVAGSRPLRLGAEVTAGSTTLLVERIYDDSELIPETVAPPRSIPATPADGVPAPWPEQQEQESSLHSDRLGAIQERSALADDQADPEPSPSRATISDPLIPGLPPTPQAAPVSIDQDVLATLPPAQAPEKPPADTGSRTFYINVLGRRIGPLSRAQARDLKTRELKGALTPSDLALAEAEAAAVPTPPPPVEETGGDEQRTYYITLLGKRVGPLSRLQARDLKARELRGDLTAEELDRLIVD